MTHALQPICTYCGDDVRRTPGAKLATICRKKACKRRLARDRQRRFRAKRRVA